MILRNQARLWLGLCLVLAIAALTPLAGAAAFAQSDPTTTGATSQVCATCVFTDIQSAVDAAAPGDRIEVLGGTYAAPLLIDKPLTLIGIDAPVIDGNDHGTIVRIASSDVTLQGFVLQNSGQNFDKEDSAVYIEGERVQIIDNQMLNTLFGVNAAQAHDLLVSGNTIIGMDVETGMRGDGIKVWYSHRTHIFDNYIRGSRDLLVWYSNDVVVRDNTVEQGRYGFHFMNSDNGLVEHNRLFDNSVGIYLMYGKGFTIRDNLLQGSRGPSGHGLGLKEIDGVDVEGNIIYDNRVGVYIDNSPLSPKVTNLFRGNLFAYNDIGLGLLPSAHNNVFTENSLVDNQEQVSVLGSGPLGVNQWSLDGRGNFWSDYAGYDADGDGVGDVPFRSEHLSERLMSSWPILRLFRFSVAESAVDFGSRAIPMFRQNPVLVDEFPLVNPVHPVNAAVPAHIPDRTSARLYASSLLLIVILIMWWGWRGSRFTAPTRQPASAAGDANRAIGADARANTSGGRS
jgi:nitrous oxidase accessory protein